MTTVRTYKVFLYGSMAGLIALGVLLGALFPNLPAWAFLGMAVVGGGGLAGTGLLIRNRWKQA